jgi:predicted lipid-binding transport protein (Tim44 family)
MFKQKWAATGLVFLAAFFLFSWTLELTADARIGGGRSFGSRGSRSYSSPSSPSTSPYQSSPSYTQQRPMGQPFGGGGMMRGVLGGIAGGLLGGMLFRSLGFAGGGGMGGGIGMMDIILIGAILYGIYWFIKRRRSQAQPYYRENTADYAQPAYAQPESINDLDRGISHIRQMDPSFDVKAFQDLCMDLFFKIQGAWTNRDVTGIQGLMTHDFYHTITEDIDRLKADKKFNRLENIAVRSVDLTEVWQEEGKDFVTAKFYANLLDYTTDETGQVISGSKTDPVKFEEYWTFTRPVGANAWQLSAITQVQ